MERDRVVLIPVSRKWQKTVYRELLEDKIFINFLCIDNYTKGDSFDFKVKNSTSLLIPFVDNSEFRKSSDILELIYDLRNKLSSKSLLLINDNLHGIGNSLSLLIKQHFNIPIYFLQHGENHLCGYIFSYTKGWRNSTFNLRDIINTFKRYFQNFFFLRSLSGKIIPPLLNTQLNYLSYYDRIYCTNNISFTYLKSKYKQSPKIFRIQSPLIKLNYNLKIETKDNTITMFTSGIFRSNGELTNLKILRREINLITKIAEVAGDLHLGFKLKIKPGEDEFFKNNLPTINIVNNDSSELLRKSHIVILPIDSTAIIEALVLGRSNVIAFETWENNSIIGDVCRNSPFPIFKDSKKSEILKILRSFKVRPIKYINYSDLICNFKNHKTKIIIE